MVFLCLVTRFWNNSSRLSFSKISISYMLMCLVDIWSWVSSSLPHGYKSKLLNLLFMWNRNASGNQSIPMSSVSLNSICGILGVTTLPSSNLDLFIITPAVTQRWQNYIIFLVLSNTEENYCDRVVWEIVVKCIYYRD